MSQSEITGPRFAGSAETAAANTLRARIASVLMKLFYASRYSLLATRVQNGDEERGARSEERIRKEQAASPEAQ